MQANDSQLRERLALLEREIFALRSALTPKRDAVSAPFDAVSVVVGSVTFALPLRPIVEIIQPVWCQPLPDAPAWVLGTFQYGRSVVPAIDIGRRLFGSSDGLSLQGFFVLAAAPNLVALVVRNIGDIVRIEPEAVAPPPADVSHAVFLSGTFTRGSGEMLPLLSMERLAREFVVEPSN
jgi:chemotaxis signal transduction protein